MIRIGRLLRDHSEAGAINSLISLWGFIDDRVFVTKGGAVGVVLRMNGPDPEGLTHEQRHRVTHQLEATLRAFDENVRVYQYLIKRRVGPFLAPKAGAVVANESFARRAAYLNERRRQLFHLDQYLVLLLEQTQFGKVGQSIQEFWRHPMSALWERLSVRHRFSLMESQLERAAADVRQLAETAETQFTDGNLRQLRKAEAFAFFRSLVNFDPAVLEATSLRYDTHLDYFVADSPVECHRDHLRIGSEFVKVQSMKEPPSQTYAHMLAGLTQLPGEFVACLEWQRLSNERVRRDLHARRRHFFNKRVSLVNYVSADTSPQEMLVDDSAGATVGQLGDALTDIEVNGHFFGSASLTLLLHGQRLEDLRTMSGEAMKTLAAHDGVFIEESYNLLNAWLSIVPGNGAYNLRRLALMETNCADLSFIHSHECGDPVCPYLQRPALAVFETPHQTPYFFNLHVNDVGHTVVLGATGSGKSFLLNFMVTQLLQHDPRIVVLDLGHSYRKLATLLEGSYVELGLRRQNVSINPFDIEHPTPEDLHFLHAFAKVLVEGEDGYRLSHTEDREVYDAIENLFVLERCQRRLFTLASLLPRGVAARLHRWIDGGRYASMFDNAEDTLSVGRLQMFDFEAMRSYPAVLEPLLFYVLHRVNQHVHDSSDPGLKVCVLDEAWRLIQHPAIRSYVQEALKTWRKKNAAMLLATQSIEDFASADLLRTVVESCPTRMLLANPSMNRDQYRDLLQMNEMELDLLASLLPRRQVLLKRANVAKILDLNVDPKSYWIYTNTPIDNERVIAACRELGFVAGLDRLAATA